MKMFLALAVITSLAFTGQQVNSWTVYHNNNLLLSTSEENEATNIAGFPKTELTVEGKLVVTYKEATPNTAWKRTVAIVDEKGNIFFATEDSNKLEIDNKQLKRIFDVTATPKVYTWSIPKDPAKAATVRVRRIHLCTLQLK